MTDAKQVAEEQVVLCDFHKKIRLKMALSSFSSYGSSNGFFIKGFTPAVMKSKEMGPDAGDSWKMSVIAGRRTSRVL